MQSKIFCDLNRFFFCSLQPLCADNLLPLHAVSDIRVCDCPVCVAPWIQRPVRVRGTPALYPVPRFGVQQLRRHTRQTSNFQSKVQMQQYRKGRIGARSSIVHERCPCSNLQSPKSPKFLRFTHEKRRRQTDNESQRASYADVVWT